MNVFKVISAIGAVSANRAWVCSGLFWAMTGWAWSVALCWVDPAAAAFSATSWVSLWVLGFWLSRKSQ